MPLPKPKPEEKKMEFIIRCMADETMVKEYPNKAQRFAVCTSQSTKNTNETKIGRAHV